MKKLSLLFAAVLAFAMNAMALNPYAYAVSVAEAGDNATISYTLNAAATAVSVVAYKDGVELPAAVLTGCDATAGAHTAVVDLSTLTEAGVYTFGVKVEGTSPAAPTKEATIFSFWSPYGMAIDVDPASANFGRLLICEADTRVTAKPAYHAGGKGPGIYAFNPDFTVVNDGAVYNGGLTFTEYIASTGVRAYNPHDVAISEDGRIFVTIQNQGLPVVCELSADLQTWTPVLNGTFAEDGFIWNYNEDHSDSTFYAGMPCSIDVKGKGENLKLLVYSCNNRGLAFSQTGFRLDEYALGTATTFVGTPTHIACLDGNYGLAPALAQVHYDLAEEGAYWFTASRGGNAGQPNLVHFAADGTRNYYSESATYYAGAGLAQYDGKLYMGLNKGYIQAYTATPGESEMTITATGDAITTGIGLNVNDIEFDYAGNMWACSNSGEKLAAFAMPYSGAVTTPVVNYEVEVEAAATETVVYMWDGNQKDEAGHIENGGTATAEGGNANTIVGKASKLNWCLNLGKGYASGVNYVKITLNAPLQGGETITTGAFVSGNSKPTADAVYGINFGGENELTLTYDADDEAASEIAYINSNMAPADKVLTVPAAAAGQTEIWLYRKSGSTTMYVSKFVVTRTTTPEPGPGPEPEITWSDFLGDGAGNGAYSNMYKVETGVDGLSYVNIQQPGWATAPGIYVSVPHAISSVSVDASTDGAGAVLHLSAFTEQITEVTIVHAQGTVTFHVWYENGNAGTPTGFENIETEKAFKFYHNGQIFIQKGDAVYTITGVRVQ